MTTELRQGEPTGLYNVKDGLRLGIAGEPFYRVEITPQGHVRMGDGWSPPVEIEDIIVGRGSYVHDQGSASTTWNVAHNLGFFPAVSVVDSGGNLVEGTVEYVDINNLIIRFTVPFGGKAYLS